MASDDRERLLALMARYVALGDQLLPRVVTNADDVVAPSLVLDEMASVKREIDKMLSAKRAI